MCAETHRARLAWLGYSGRAWSTRPFLKRWFASRHRHRRQWAERANASITSDDGTGHELAGCMLALQLQGASELPQAVLLHSLVQGRELLN